MKGIITNLVGTGTVASLLQIANADPLVSGIVNMGLAISTGSLITYDSLNQTKLLNAKIQNIKTFVEEVQQELDTQKLAELRRFINLDSDPESLNILESLIKEGIEAKTDLYRKLIAKITVYFNKDESHSTKDETLRALGLLKILDAIDMKFLNVLASFYLIKWLQDNNFSGEYNEMLEKARTDHETNCKELISDNNYYAEDLYNSSIKFEMHGLIQHKSSLKPEDELLEDEGYPNNSNKQLMLEFLFSHNQDSTVVFAKFFATLYALPV